MFCSNCGRQLLENRRFCSFCGKKSTQETSYLFKRTNFIPFPSIFLGCFVGLFFGVLFPWVQANSISKGEISISGLDTEWGIRILLAGAVLLGILLLSKDKSLQGISAILMGGSTGFVSMAHIMYIESLVQKNPDIISARVGLGLWLILAASAGLVFVGIARLKENFSAQKKSSSFCIKCGRKQTETWKICPYCGIQTPFQRK